MCVDMWVCVRTHMQIGFNNISKGWKRQLSVAPMLQMRLLRLREVKGLGDFRSLNSQLSTLSPLMEQRLFSCHHFSCCNCQQAVRFRRLLTLANTGVKLVGSPWSISQTVLTASWQQSGHWDKSRFQHMAFLSACPICLPSSATKSCWQLWVQKASKLNP